jgi:hypothetical protein
MVVSAEVLKKLTTRMRLRDFWCELVSSLRDLSHFATLPSAEALG